MQTFTHYSTRAVCRFIDTSGVAEVSFSGLMDAKAFQSLRGKVGDAIKGARACVLLLDKATVVLSINDLQGTSFFGADSPPAAIVIDPGQYAVVVSCAAALTANGAVRVVFLNSPEQTALAYRWAFRRAWVVAQQLPVTQRYTQ